MNSQKSLQLLFEELLFQELDQYFSLELSKIIFFFFKILFVQNIFAEDQFTLLFVERNAYDNLSLGYSRQPECLSGVESINKASELASCMQNKMQSKTLKTH